MFAIAGIPAFRLVPMLGNEHMGVAQRVLIGLLLAWNVATQLYVSRASDGSGSDDRHDLVDGCELGPPDLPR